MNAILERSQRFLDRPLGIGPRLLLLFSAAVLFPIPLPLISGVRGSPTAAWIPFALGILALLLLRACVQGKTRDLLDAAVLAVYFVLFLLWSSPSTAEFYRSLAAAFLLGGALAMAWTRSVSEDLAERRMAG